MSAKADQDRQIDAAQLQAVDQLLQIDRAGRVLGRMHEDVAVIRDREVALSPAGDFVQFGGVVDGENLTRLPRSSAGRGATHATMIHRFLLDDAVRARKFAARRRQIAARRGRVVAALAVGGAAPSSLFAEQRSGAVVAAPSRSFRAETSSLTPASRARHQPRWLVGLAPARQGMLTRGVNLEGGAPGRCAIRLGCRSREGGRPPRGMTASSGPRRSRRNGRNAASKFVIAQQERKRLSWRSAKNGHISRDDRGYCACGDAPSPHDEDGSGVLRGRSCARIVCQRRSRPASCSRPRPGSGRLRSHRGPACGARHARLHRAPGDFAPGHRKRIARRIGKRGGRPAAAALSGSSGGQDVRW